MKKLDPFAVESLRETYARAGNRQKFISTYLKDFPSIADHNTPDSWEKLLHDIPDVQDPMTADRITQTASMIQPLAQITTGLDIGIGNGWVEKRVNAHHPEKFAWTGIDITRKNVTRLKKELKGDMYQGDILMLPKSVRALQFDYVLLLEVLEHIPHIHTFTALKNIHDLLADDGFFIMSVPINENLQEKINNGTNFSHHVRRYTPEIIQMELDCAGFEILESRMLYAFSHLYRLKSVLARFWHRWEPNVIIIKARKRA